MPPRSDTVSDGDFQGLNEDVRDIWDQNAEFWNHHMGEGNEFHRVLIAPAQERLLNLRPGDIVLDVGCGNGQFTRRMAALGAQVVAVDVSARMIANAKAITPQDNQRIDYRVVDATDRDALVALGERRFDAAVSTMTLMDMASLEPLLSSLQQILKPAAPFVFSICHPCFNSPRNRLTAEEVTSDGGVPRTRYSVSISDYLSAQATKGVAMKAQPAVQYYFDRPLSVLFNACFKAGFVLDGLEEPGFSESKDDGRASWRNLIDVPPILVARMRLAR